MTLNDSSSDPVPAVSENVNNGNHNGKPRQNTNQKYEPFNGDSSKLQGHVFQLPHERNKNVGASQYADTVDQLRLYVSTDLDAKDDTKQLVLNALKDNEALKMPDTSSLEVPTKSGDDFTDKIKIQEYSEDRREVLKLIEDAKKAKRVIFGITFGQCSTSLREKLKQTEEYKTADANQDFIALLKEIQKHTSTAQPLQDEFLQVHMTTRALHNFRQNGRSNSDYMNSDGIPSL